MADRTYYWIKLQMDFFKSPVVRLLRRMSGGDTYALIYLEMILLSLENSGYIYYTGIGKDMADEISLALDEKKIDVEFLLSFLTNKRLIEFSDPNAFRFSDDVTDGLIGKETSSAKRVRAWRKRQLALQSNTEVTTSNTEIDIELEKEIDIDIEKVHSPAKAEPCIPYPEIIEYLNQKADTNYRESAKKTRTLIKARCADGFSLDDFKKVIDVKTSEWLKTDMAKFLRPETLFGTKFESYLNQKPVSSGKSMSTYNPPLPF